MPGHTVLDIPQAEQEQMLAHLRAARYGHLLACHILLLRAAGRTPPETAAALFCSRPGVYRTARACRRGALALGLSPAVGAPPAPRCRASLKRSLRALLKRAPAAFGWCRTRWSCACLAAELKTRRGVAVSQESVRRWLHELGYVRKRARHVARDDPERVTKLARTRRLIEHLRPARTLFFADELDIHLLAKLGCEWRLKGTRTEVMTPGTSRKHYLAGALNYVTGKLPHVTNERKDRWPFIDLLRVIDRAYPTDQFTKLYVVVDNYGIHKAKAVVTWLATHPRSELVILPGYCPRANPIERVFGDVHDKCTRNHKRTQITDLVADVKAHLRWNGPWRYKLSELYYTPEVTAAVAELKAAAQQLAA